jgi:hypothetical protein
MAKAFAYIVASVASDYFQKDKRNVPVWRGGTQPIYFGPCKKEMRYKAEVGACVFGISSGDTRPRRIVFIMPVAERMSFAQAYTRFSDLRGGPIHVRPIPGGGYEHIPGAIHEENDAWKDDVNPPYRDVFLVGQRLQGEDEKARRYVGVWLGPKGPVVKGRILSVLRRMSVWKGSKRYREANDDGTETAPIRAGGLYTGLHCEGDEQLLRELLQACLENLPPDVLLPSGSWGDDARSGSTSGKCCR